MMAYHIKKTSLWDSSKILYYIGNRHWVDNYIERKIYSDDPSSLFVNPDGKNGGWTNATVVSE